MREKNVPGNSQHGFTEDKSFLSNLVACCDRRPALVEERRVVAVICHDFSKVFDTVSHYILGYK